MQAGGYNWISSGPGKNITAQDRRGDPSLQDDPRWRPGGGGALRAARILVDPAGRLLRLQKRAPINSRSARLRWSRGSFCGPIEPLGEYLKQRGVGWTYYRDKLFAFGLLEEQPDHGCDLCSRYRAAGGI